MHLYGFAFVRNISSTVLHQLEGIDHRIILYKKPSIDSFIGKLVRDQPEYILGLGRYTGRDQVRIRIETVCTNRFGKQNIVNENPPSHFANAQASEGHGFRSLQINPFLSPLLHSKYASTLGTSYCNYVCYWIMEAVQLGELKSKFTFLHIPVKMKIHTVVSEIHEMLQHFKGS